MYAEPPPVFALDHYGVQVADLERAVAWYSDHLGLHEVERLGQPNGFAAVFLEGHGARLELFTSADEGPAPGTNRTHLAFRVGDLDAATEQLTARSVTVVQPRVTNEAVHRASVLFADPDGNVVELTQLLDT